MIQMPETLIGENFLANVGNYYHQRTKIPKNAKVSILDEATAMLIRK